MTPPSVQRIDKFDVLCRLGRGGMGSVYLARDPDMDRLVAIKLLHEGFDDEELRGRFSTEARSASALRHTNIVTIFQTGTFLERPFIVMEYVAGQTFADIAAGGATPIAQKLLLLDQLLAGLQHAHAKGIVHRDIKPANVMVDSEGVVRILDFGIARLGDGGLTRTGVVLGTLNYMAPEQLAGQVVDARADIFSAGLVGYELLSSKRAFPQEFPEVLRQIGFTDPPSLETVCPGINPALVRIIERCLAKQAEDRYSDCAAIRRDLDVVRHAIDEPGVDTGSTLVAAAPASLPPAPAAVPSSGALRVDDAPRPPTDLPAAVAPHIRTASGSEPIVEATMIVPRGSAPRTGTGTSAAEVPPSRRPVTATRSKVLAIAGVTLVVAAIAFGVWRTTASRDESSDPASAAAGISGGAPPPAVVDERAAGVPPAVPTVPVAPAAPAADSPIAGGVDAVTVQGDRLRARASDAWKRGDVEAALTSLAAATAIGPHESTDRLMAEFTRASRDRASAARRRAVTANGRGMPEFAAANGRSVEADRQAKQGQSDAAVRSYLEAARRFDDAAARAPVPAAVRVGGAVPAPARVKRVNPEYPAAARSARVQGVVMVEATIGVNGKVQEVRVIRSIPALDYAAVEAVKQWEYEPLLVDGVAVPVISSVAVEFKLQAPRPVRVGGTIKPPAQTRRVSPPYPPEAQAANVQGVVIMEATIGVDGKVTDVRVLRSIPLLDQAAMDAVRQWEYAPTIVNDIAVPVLMTVTVNFTLAPPASPTTPAPAK